MSRRARTGPGLSLRAAECIIRVACRVLPDAERTDREREWAAEAEAIIDDADLRLPAARVLRFTLSLLHSVRSLRGVRATQARSGDRSVDMIMEVLGVFGVAVVAQFIVIALIAGNGFKVAGIIGAVGGALGLFILYTTPGFLLRRTIRRGLEK